MKETQQVFVEAVVNGASKVPGFKSKKIKIDDKIIGFSLSRGSDKTSCYFDGTGGLIVDGQPSRPATMTILRAIGLARVNASVNLELVAELSRKGGD